MDTNKTQNERPTEPFTQVPGSATGSATERRMQVARMDRAGVTLTLYPGGQAEAIARHYVAMANTARDLLALLEARDGYGRRLSETDAVVAFLVGEIKERHANDFGIPLEWPNDKAEWTAKTEGEVVK